MYKYILLLISFAAHAKNMTCDVYSEVAGAKQPSHTIVMELVDGPLDQCSKTEKYDLPGTAVVITVNGRGKCQIDHSQDSGCKTDPSVGPIEINDTKGGFYAKSNWDCYNTSENSQLQFTTHGENGVNLIVWCKLQSGPDKSSILEKINGIRDTE